MIDYIIDKEVPVARYHNLVAKLDADSMLEKLTNISSQCLLQVRLNKNISGCPE